jgi:hypothetical protein
MNRKKSHDEKTADELLKEQATDPEYGARMDKRVTAAKVMAEGLRLEQVPILADLRGVGVNVADLWALVMRKEPYPTAIPVLLEHLRRGYSPRTRQAIARALAVPDANAHWSELMKLFLAEPPVGPNDVRFALGAALWGAARPPQFPAIRELISQRQLGSARLPLLRAALEVGGVDGEDLVRSFVRDEQLGREARKLLKLKAMTTLKRYGPKA